jgi:hypothetical protein
MPCTLLFFYENFNLQALLHASVVCRRKLVVDWVASTDLEESTATEVFYHLSYYTSSLRQ